MSLVSEKSPVLDGLSESSNVRHYQIPATLLIALLALIFPQACLPPTSAQSPIIPPPAHIATPVLKQGTTVEQELARGMQAYPLDLEGDQYVELLLIKGDLHLTATILSPRGETLVESISTRYEPLRLSLISNEPGRYRVEIRSVETKDLLRRYHLTVKTLRLATLEDRHTIQAVALFLSANKLRAEWRESALRESISKYTESAEIWQFLRRYSEAAEALERVGDIYFSLSENRQALSHYLRAQKLAGKAHDRQTETREMNKVGYVHVYLGKGKTALAYSAQARKYHGRHRAYPPTADDRRNEADAHNTEGEAHYALGNPRRSIISFNYALDLWKEAQDRRGQALGNLNLGYAYSDLGDLQNAQKYFGEALSLWQEIGDRRGEAQALTGFGTVHAFLGEKQMALDRHAQAMEIFRALGDREGQAVALNSIGQAYEDLNELQTALDNYERALQIYQERAHEDFEGVTQYYLGRVHNSLGDKKKALELFRKSAKQGRESGQARLTAFALSAISGLRSSEGHSHEALGQLNKALRLFRSVDDRRGQVDALNGIGTIFETVGAKQRALQYYRQAYPLSVAAGDRAAEANTLYNIARVEAESGSLEDALRDVKDSLRTVESLRAQIVSPNLRASYYASVHKHSELYIDLLMRLDKLHPERRLSGLALQASENARARAAIETLGETSAEIRQGVDPKLLERERDLQQRLGAKAQYQMRAMGRHDDPEELEKTNREVRELNIAYQEVETQIKQQSPRYATLVQPQPLTLEDIQAELKDPDTLLLEYALGEERSYVWAVTSNSITSYQLPARSQIEGAARELYRLLTLRQSLLENASSDYQQRVTHADTEYWGQAARLSQTLLGQVAAQLGRKRLLIVADGALQYLPFEALPIPASSESEPQVTAPAPMVLNHEIISLPSASTLAVIRRGSRPLESDDKLLAILADPVFERDDPRLTRLGLPSATVASQPTAESRHTVSNETLGQNELTDISRLPATRQESDAILTVAPAGTSLVARDFNASRDTAMSGRLGQYRVVHFATHGIINTEHPQLSGILLSLLNRKGGNEKGFLQLHDVYNLDLSGTQLVVLSACRTGLGKEVRGEGLIGLTRGFMYAGSKSVVASLWKVDDRATAELMKHFYQGMFEENLAPAAALRKAKELMWKQERWRAPYFWSAFILQGEYRDPIAMPQASRARTYLLLAGAILMIIFARMGWLSRHPRKRIGDHSEQ